MKKTERVRVYQRNYDKVEFVLFDELETKKKISLFECNATKSGNYEDIKVSRQELKNEYTLVREYLTD